MSLIRSSFEEERCEGFGFGRRSRGVPVSGLSRFASGLLWPRFPFCCDDCLFRGRDGYILGPRDLVRRRDRHGLRRGRPVAPVSSAGCQREPRSGIHRALGPRLLCVLVLDVLGWSLRFLCGRCIVGGAGRGLSAVGPLIAVQEEEDPVVAVRLGLAIAIAAVAIWCASVLAYWSIYGTGTPAVLFMPY